VSDIFNEVDEDLRRENLRKIWDKYGNWIFAAALVIVIGVGGWRGWQYWQGQLARTAGAEFEAAVTLSEAGKAAEAEVAFEKIAKDGPAGYRVLARLRAAETLASHDKESGVKAFDAIAADGALKPLDRDLAAIRAAYLLIDSLNYDALLARLQPLSAESRPFRHTARELLAFSAWRAKNETAARQWIDTILSDPSAPAGLRSRINVLRALLPPAAKS